MTKIYPLRAGLYAAVCGLDLVLLDTVTGSYDLAAGAGRDLMVAPTGAGVIFPTPALRTAFVEAGLLADTPPPAVPRLPPLPERSALAEPGSIHLLDVWRHGRTWLEMVHPYPRLSLPDLIARVRTQEPRHAADPERILVQARAFDRLLAWTPGQGACVYRAYMLRRWLQRAGLGGVRWVFGVRTWPFYAHCWLQLDEVSLTDPAEALVAFTPIFAV